MRSTPYRRDVLAGGRRLRTVAEVVAEPDLVVEHAADGYCGAVVAVRRAEVVLEDRHGRRRLFPLRPATFLLDGVPVTLVAPAAGPAERAARTASGSVAVPTAGQRARVARAGRIWVEGVHDAELVERVWGHDLRVAGVVVEPLHGVDEVVARIADFGPGPQRRLGVLVDHAVRGSKESRLAGQVAGPHVLVTGHPYVDVWQAVKPAAVGIAGWPAVPRGVPWKEGICAALGWGGPAAAWRRVLAAVGSYTDLEPPLVGAVERLIDFVTAEPSPVD